MREREREKGSEDEGRGRGKEREWSEERTKLSRPLNIDLKVSSGLGCGDERLLRNPAWAQVWQRIQTLFDASSFMICYICVYQCIYIHVYMY